MATETFICGTGCCDATVDCCEGNLPLTLKATLADAGSCACLDGVEVTLTWNGTTAWEGTTAVGCTATPVRIKVICTAGIWSMSIKCGGAAPPAGLHVFTSADCGPPLLLVMTSISAALGCCAGGTVSVVVGPA